MTVAMKELFGFLADVWVESCHELFQNLCGDIHF